MIHWTGNVRPLPASQAEAVYRLFSMTLGLHHPGPKPATVRPDLLKLSAFRSARYHEKRGAK